VSRGDGAGIGDGGPRSLARDDAQRDATSSFERRDVCARRLAGRIVETL